MSRLLHAAMLTAVFATGGYADDRFAGMDAYIKDAMKEWGVPGLAVAVIEDGKMIVSAGYGVRTIDTDDKVTPDTVFPIASCTKGFTTASLSILRDEGRLAWNDRLRQHLPDFRVADPYVTEHVTLRDLACHRTGWAAGHLLFVKGDLPHDEIIRRMQHLKQAKPFRSHQTYNNVAFLLLGDIVGKTSGGTWHRFVQQRLLTPLDMKATYLSHTLVPADVKATRHRRYNDGIHPMRTPSTDDLVAPAGAIWSSAPDMLKWLQLQLNLGRHNDRPLIQAESVKEMHSLQKSIPIKWDPGANVYRPKLVGTGLGWFTQDYRGRKSVEHGGGWGAETAFVPEENFGVVVLSNLDNNGLVWMLKRDLMDAILVGPDTAWNKDKWDLWKKIGGPGHMFRNRNEARKKADAQRRSGTEPSQPISRFAGRYESQLYGFMELKADGDGLLVDFGHYHARLTHWHDDAFYGDSVVEPFLDWLVKFEFADDPSEDQLEIVSIGWKNPDDRHFYKRVP